MKRKIFTLFLSLFTVSLLQAQTWDGSASTDWNTAANWSTNAVPISTGSVIIPVPGVITNWPVMANDVTIGRITMNSGSQLNTTGFNITLTNTAGGCDITGAVITNGVPANTSLFYVPGGGTNINGSTFNGNFHFTTTSGAQTTNVANTAANTWNGNTTFTILVGESFNLCTAFPSTFNGNLTINKPADITDNANANLFLAGGVINGNFTLNFDDESRLWIGSLGITTRVGGQLNMNINNVASSMQIYGLKNHTTGGSIVLNNVDIGISIEEDSLLVNTIDITQTAESATIDTCYIQATLNYNSTAPFTQSIFIRNTTFNGDVNFNTSVSIINEGFVQRCYYLGNASFTSTSGNITLGNSDTSFFHKNVTVNTGGTLTIRGLRFVGNTNSQLTQLGTQPLSMNQLIMEKTGGASLTFNDSVTVTTTATFTSGNIITGTDKHLIFPNNISYTGASVSSHVVGPVTKIGDDAFTFPVGTASSLNPVAMTAPAGATSKFSAQYFLASPTTVGDTALKDPALLKLSNCEYWDVKRLIGASTTTLTFTFAAPCAGGIYYINNPAFARIAHWTGSTWENLGNGGSTGTTTGTVTTAAPVNNFSPFTFGTVDANLNPLPLTLRNFYAVKCNSNVCIAFATENEINFDHFEIEKSSNGSNFSTIENVLAKGGTSLVNYSATDNQPFAGVNYYRLKLVDKNGKFTYSHTVKIDFSKKYTITILPNPASSYIIINGANAFKQIQIINTDGKVVKQMNKANDNRYNLSGLSKGFYLVRLIGTEETVITKIIIE